MSSNSINNMENGELNITFVDKNDISYHNTSINNNIWNILNKKCLADQLWLIFICLLYYKYQINEN